MATDDVIGFFHDLLGDRKLNERVYCAPRTSEAWVDTARQSGYVFSLEDLKTVAEEIVQKPLSRDTLIHEVVDELVAKEDAADVTPESEKAFAFSGHAVARLKAVMQQGRYSGYYRPW